MVKLTQLIVLIGLLSLGLLPISWAKSNFEAGKDYQVISINSPANKAPSNNIAVLEFFSFGCPACYFLEADLEKWEQSLSQQVTFKRVPVIFHPGWEVYAKTYYILDGLGKSEAIAPKLFAAIHQERKALESEQAMADFLKQFSIQPEIFSKAYNHSLAIDSQLAQAKRLLNTYQVYQVPTLVIAGRYKTDLSMAQGNAQRMLEIANFLIKHAQNDLRAKTSS
ncbi:MAG: thiol:disulfide interchange protein DsbA/DsbL [Gammaproteobacteria bacterium]